MKLKAVLFGGVAAVTALLVFFTRSSSAATVDPVDPKKPKPGGDPVPPPPPPPPPPPIDGCPTGVAAGVSMSPTTVQSALNKAGANPQLAVDGKIGTGSKAAIQEFQYNNGLPQTGCVDAKTAAKLQPFAALSGAFKEIYQDQNKMTWTLTRPTLSVWRATQNPIDTTGDGAWQNPYPEEPAILEAPSRVTVIERIENAASGYDMGGI